MIRDDILKELFLSQDVTYRDFQSKLIPTVPADTVIGVRTPILKSLAKRYMKRDDASSFFDELPHEYFDENQMHAFMISLIRDLDECIFRVEQFLPYVDNWATCDQLNPKAFAKNRDKMADRFIGWLDSEETYTVRFGIRMLMTHFLDRDFDDRYPRIVADTRSSEYYINMMRAWYFATALAKQYEAVIPYIEEKRLDAWTHNKTIQKAVESYRIAEEQKKYLKTFRIKK